MDRIRDKKLNINLVKSRNKELVLQSLLDGGEMTRTQIAKLVSISNATVGTIIDELLDLKVVVEAKDNTTSIGRRPNIVRINDGRVYSLVIDLSSKYHFSYSIINVNNKVLMYDENALTQSKPYKKQFEAFLADIYSQLQAHSISDNLIGICANIPGVYIKENNRIISKTVPGLETINPVNSIKSHWDVNVIVDNDTNLVTHSYFSNNHDLHNKKMLFVYIGEGIGSSIVINGEIYEGAHGFAGEIGQMLVGGGQTLEQAASWGSWTKRMAEKYNISGSDEEIEDFIMIKHEHKDEEMLKEIDSVIDVLAGCFANIVWIINPDTIYLCGGYADFGIYFANELKNKISKRLPGILAEKLTVDFVEYSKLSATVGANHSLIHDWIRKVSSAQ